MLDAERAGEAEQNTGKHERKEGNGEKEERKEDRGKEDSRNTSSYSSSKPAARGGAYAYRWPAGYTGLSARTLTPSSLSLLSLLSLSYSPLRQTNATSRRYAGAPSGEVGGGGDELAVVGLLEGVLVARLGV